MKKPLGIVVLGLLKSYPINYRRTCTRLGHREIKNSNIEVKNAKHY